MTRRRLQISIACVQFSIASYAISSSTCSVRFAWHKFDHPGGVSGLALLSESHLTCHTYPEFQAATFNLYCCRNRASWTWETTLKEMLGATDVTVRKFERMIHEDAHTMAGAAK